MTHTARLETESGGFVASTKLAYGTLPAALFWGTRLFFLHEAGANGHPSRYRERFWAAVVETSGEDPLARGGG